MVARIQQVLGYRLSIAELLGIAFLVGVPYFFVGLIWAVTHEDHLRGMAGADLVVSFLGSIVSWPVLTFSNVCMA